MAGEERTEAPTPRRREEARRRGHVARSTDLTAVAVVFAVLVALRLFGPHMMDGLLGITRGTLTMLPSPELTPDQAHALFLDLLLGMAVIVAPVCVGAVAAGLMANALQVGVVWTDEPLRPRFDRLNPLEGLSRLVSGRALMELAKSSVKFVAVGSIAFLVVRDHWEAILSLATLDPRTTLDPITSLAFELLVKVGAALLVLAALDYLNQRRTVEASLRMTRQELLEELRQTEGDPHVRARRRQQQRQLSRYRMLAAVPKASVVVTNPTHLAVALRYEAEETLAPVVVAKGARLLAEQIKQTARRHGVPVVENRPLAQALYKSVEVGMMVPVALYQAVAEVLAFVYRLRGRGEVLANGS